MITSSAEVLALASSALEIIDGHRLYRISEREAEDARVEVQLTFERTLNVLGAVG